MFKGKYEAKLQFPVHWGMCEGQGGGGGGVLEGIKPKIPPCREYGHFLEQHIAYQVYRLDYIKRDILYSYLKEDLVRQVLEEMKILFEQNQKEV